MAASLTSYLLPALARGNVTLKTGALATKLLFEKDRCVGVEYVVDGQVSTVRAEHQVIVCCGAIESPKLLMLSGIGDAEQLKQLGIPVRTDLPGVGQNFQDHPLVIGPIGWMTQPGADPKGQMTEVSLFWKSMAGMVVPDLQISLVHRAPFGEAFFANVVQRLQTGQPVTVGGAAGRPARHPDPARAAATALAGLGPLAKQRPDGGARHQRELWRRADRHRSPGDDGRDRAEHLRHPNVRAARTAGAQPGPDVSSPAQLRDWVIENTGSYYHFVGSCKMGIDRQAVVDPQLRVYGVDGLRVADGSIMPTIPSANTHTTIVMIGERAADFIKSEA